MTTDEAHSDGHEAPADHIPVPGEDLRGWRVEQGTDDAVDDRLLIGPDGEYVETWRDGYPYRKRMTRKDYEKAKRSLQIELLEMQRLRRQRLRGWGAAGPAVPAALNTRPRGEPP